MGNREEKRLFGKQLHSESQHLLQIKQSRAVEERKRDIADGQDMHRHAAAAGAARDYEAA